MATLEERIAALELKLGTLTPRRFPQGVDQVSVLSLLDKVLVGVNADGSAKVAAVNQIVNLVTAAGGSGLEPTVAPNTTLPAPTQSGKFMFMNGGNYTQPDEVTPLVVPANSFNLGYWDGSVWSVPISIEIVADLSPITSKVDGGSTSFGVTDSLTSYSTAYSGVGTMRINDIFLQQDSIVKKIIFNCRRAGTVSIRFLRLTESDQVYAYNVMSFSAVLGVNEFVSGADFDEFTMRAGDMYSTYASNNLGSVGFKSKTAASYVLTGSLGATPVDWSEAVLGDNEWGMKLEVEVVGLVEQAAEINHVVFSESNPILKQSSLGVSEGAIDSINGTPIKASESVFDQSLNTYDNVEFANVKANGMEMDLPSGATEPSGLSIGDAWIDTANGNVIKVKLV